MGGKALQSSAVKDSGPQGKIRSPAPLRALRARAFDRAPTLRLVDRCQHLFFLPTEETIARAVSRFPRGLAPQSGFRVSAVFPLMGGGRRCSQFNICFRR